MKQSLRKRLLLDRLNYKFLFFLVLGGLVVVQLGCTVIFLVVKITITLISDDPKIYRLMSL